MAKLDEQRSKDEMMLNDALNKCSEFSTFMMSMQSQMSVQSNLEQLMEGLEKEVHRLTEKVGNDSNSQQARNQQLVVKIEEAFAQRLAIDSNSNNELSEFRLTDFRGLKQGNTKIISFPDNEILHKTAFCKLSNFTKLEYDIGTHIRCMKFSMTDPTTKN